jgi:hypothetical protein
MTTAAILATFLQVLIMGFPMARIAVEKHGMHARVQPLHRSYARTSGCLLTSVLLDALRSFYVLSIVNTA